MPNIKSSKKSVRTDKIKTATNTSYTSKVKNGMKRIDTAIKNKDAKKASELLKTTLADIDKCTSKGIMKKNTSAREKSRLNNKVKEMK
jgi:small subunit ribosomal protein S20